MKRMAMGLAVAVLLGGCGTLRNPIDDGEVVDQTAQGAAEDVEVIEIAPPADSDSTAVEEETAVVEGLVEGDSLIGQALTLRGEELYEANGESLPRLFYFPFDSAVIADDDFEALRRHAAWLAANPNVTVRLEGHADERGSREYNLALGERRARAVADLLWMEGVAPEQVEQGSYGEEKPLDPGHDEGAWAQNRRVELLYRAR